MRLAVMQGRLTPGETLQAFPPDWEAEFPLAAAAGFAGIEWLLDEAPNPIETDEGIARLRAVSAEHGVEVRSLCAHRLIQRGEIDVDHLIERCRLAGIERIVLPFLEGVAPDPSLLRPEVVVEGELAGVPLNYDTGNERGRRIDELGPRIRSVHLKDVDGEGRNVPLGTGVVDFGAVFAALERIGYDGDLVLETPRPQGDPAAWGRRQVEFVSRLAPWTSWH